MGALAITVDAKDRGRLHLRGEAAGSDVEAVLDSAFTLLAASPAQVVLDIPRVGAADSLLVAFLRELARHAGRLHKRVILEIPDDAPDWLANASFDQSMRIERTRLVQVAAKSARPVRSPVVAPADGTARRQGRGFVWSYGDGRRCAAEGCATNLSRYNSDELCWLHEANTGSRRG